MVLGFKNFLFEKKLFDFLNEKTDISHAFIANGDNKKELLRSCSKKELENCFLIKGELASGETWWFIYKEYKDLKKEYILKCFTKMFTDYSVGTGVENFTRVQIEEI